MAKGVINLQKESGGVTKITSTDGITNTELVLPESGNIVSVDTAVTDNAIARYDGTTGKLQNSGVVIDDNGNVVIGGSTATFSAGVSRGISIESPGPYADTEFRVNGSGSWFTSFSNNTTGAGYGGWKHIGSSGQTKNWVYTAGQGEIQFGTDGAERMRIGTSGNLLIGTSTDNGIDKLQVNGSISSGTIPIISNGDLNDYKTRTQVLGIYPSAYVSNGPINDHAYVEVIVYSPDVWVMQRLTTLGFGTTPGRIFVRCLANGVWSPWAEK